MLALTVVHRELLRRAFLRAEDPRALGALRIAFTAVAIVGVLEPVVDATWWFSDEGIFLRDGAREYMTAGSLAGLQDGFDAVAAWYYLTAGYATPLHFWDTPAVVAVWTTALMLALVGLLLGLRTRACAWIVVVLYIGLLRRDALWVAGEQIYCSGFVLLAMSRCGHAYSLDNWLRCRSLRRSGRLSQPGGPGDGAGTPTLAAIYRRIPAWPRLLVIAQLTVAYGLNGLNKDGKQWWDGTALFYVLQCDWARFDGRPLVLWLGVDATAWASWSVRAWETLFPLVTLGLILRFAARERLPTPRAAHWLWPAFGASALLVITAFADHHPRRDLDASALVALGWWITWILVVILAIFRTRMLTVLDPWLLGRRVWLTGALLFTAGLVLTLNVGAFPLATLTLTLALFRGEEIAGLVARLRGRPAILCEDPTLPHLHHDGAALPASVLASIAAVLFIGAAADVADAPTWTWRWVVLAAAVLLLILGLRTRPVREDISHGPWAYGPLGRLLVGSLCAVHLTALAVNSVPNWPKLDELRRALRRPTIWWLRVSGMYQYWEMFAGGGGRDNAALITRVVDADSGEHVNISHLPHPFVVWNSRRNKLYANTLRGKNHRLWYARAICRQFARDHGGRTPLQVDFIKREASIRPPAEDVLPDRLARFEVDAVDTPLQTFDCRQEPHAQLPADLRARLGLPPPDVTFVPLPAGTSWPTTRDKQGPLWPYDEWLALLAITALLRRWRHGGSPGDLKGQVARAG
ncbi:MAG: hypothetical protein JNL82_05505 [Myxococcales bacterium]|nr:hypothetical protein [Myxococcales bacterium]